MRWPEDTVVAIRTHIFKMGFRAGAPGGHNRTGIVDTMTAGAGGHGAASRCVRQSESCRADHAGAILHGGFGHTNG